MRISSPKTRTINLSPSSAAAIGNAWSIYGLSALVAATSLLALPLVRLQTLVASSSTFQSWTSSASVADARERVHLVAADPGEVTRPFALVALGDSLDIESLAQQAWEQRGELFLLFEGPVDADTEYEAENEFATQVDAVVSEMAALAGQTDYLSVTNIELADGPAHASAEEVNAGDDFYQAIYRVEYGI